MSDKTCNKQNPFDKILIEEDEDIHKLHLSQMYYGTISVCIIYIIISLAILLFGYFNSAGYSLIFGTLLPFMFIYIVGSIIIIVYFAEKIRNFKVPKRLPMLYQRDSCPDYWNAQYVKDVTVKDVVDKSTVDLFKTRCVLPKDIISRKNLMDKAIVGTTNYPQYSITNTYNPTDSDIINNLDNKGYEKYHLYIDLKDDTSNLESSKLYKYFQNKFPNAKDTEIKKYVDNFKIYSQEMNKYKPKENNDGSIIGYELIDEYKGKVNTDPPAGKPEEVATFNKQKNKIINNTPLFQSDALGNNYTMIGADTTSDVDKKTDKLPLVCDTVYPKFLAKKDNDYVLNNPGTKENNLYRCAYANVCGVTWTDINCDDNNLYNT